MFKNNKQKFLLSAFLSFCLVFTLPLLATTCPAGVDDRVTAPEESFEEGLPEDTEEVEAVQAEEAEEEETEEPQEEQAEEEASPIYRIIFFSNHEGQFSIYYVFPGSTDVNLLFDSGFNDFGPSWNSDHTKFVFPSNRDGDDSYDLFTFGVNTGEIERLTDRAENDFYPNYGPGESVVFASLVGPAEESNFEIFIVNDTVRQLTDDPGFDESPHLSPDGNTIIFTSDRSGFGKLYTMDPEGKKIVRISEEGSWWDRDGTFSPDGKNIAYVSTRDGNDDIWVMPLDDPGAAINLTNNPSSDISPDWSPDGRKIVFASNRDTGEDNYDIFWMDADGGNQENLTPDLADSYQDAPSWQ